MALLFAKRSFTAKSGLRAFSSIAQQAPLVVSTEWLHQNLNNNDLVIYDGSWNGLNSKRPHARQEWTERRIPNALFFDIDEVSDKRSTLPHMLPPLSVFEKKMIADGVRNNSHVVVYDSNGIFSSARLLWTFKVFGHQQVSVLEGGLPEWIEKQFPLHDANSPLRVRGFSRYRAQYQPELVRTFEDINAILDKRGRFSTAQVVDARSKGRFDGKDPEPRPIPSGHMPGAINLPYASVLDESGRHFLPADKLQELFKKAGLDLHRPIVTSCGSGVTASVLFLALQLAGVPKSELSLYDGSWSEWAVRSTKIETTAE